MKRAYAIGGFCLLLALAYACIVWQCGLRWFAPVAGSFVIVFGQPESPMARGRCLVGGHLCAFAAGAMMQLLAEDANSAILLATCLSFALMMLFDCVHSPAGATSAVVVLSSSPLLQSATALGVGVALALAAKTAMDWLAGRGR